MASYCVEKILTYHCYVDLLRHGHDLQVTANNTVLDTAERKALGPMWGLTCVVQPYNRANATCSSGYAISSTQIPQAMQM